MVSLFSLVILPVETITNIAFNISDISKLNNRWLYMCSNKETNWGEQGKKCKSKRNRKCYRKCRFMESCPPILLTYTPFMGTALIQYYNLNTANWYKPNQSTSDYPLAYGIRYKLNCTSVVFANKPLPFIAIRKIYFLDNTEKSKHWNKDCKQGHNSPGKIWLGCARLISNCLLQPTWYQPWSWWCIYIGPGFACK